MMHNRITSYFSAILKTSAIAMSLIATHSTAWAADSTTLTVVDSQWLDALRGKALWHAVEQYQQQAPNIKLKREMIPSSEIPTKLMTELAGGQAADIMIIQEGLFYSAADAGFLTNISKAVEDNEHLNSTNDNGIVQGKRLGVAWQRAPYALIYNKSLLEDSGAKVPTTLDELITAATKVHNHDHVIGFTARHRMADVGGWEMDFQNWAYGYGVHWVDEDGKLTINTPEAVKAIKAFQKIYDAGLIPKGDDFPTQRTRFKQGQVAFSIDNSGGTLNIANGGKVASEKIAGALLPFPHPGAHQQLFIAVNAASEHKAAAINFIHWLVSEPGQQALRKASGPDTLATDIPIDPDFLAKNPWAKAFAKAGEHSRSTLIPGHEKDTPAIMRTVMGAVEKVIVGHADPSRALAMAQRKIDMRY